MNDQGLKPPFQNTLRVSLRLRGPVGLACALLAGLLLSCRIVHSNQVEVVKGQVELVVPAEQNPYGYVSYDNTSFR